MEKPRYVPPNLTFGNLFQQLFAQAQVEARSTALTRIGPGRRGIATYHNWIYRQRRRDFQHGGKAYYQSKK